MTVPDGAPVPLGFATDAHRAEGAAMFTTELLKLVYEMPRWPNELGVEDQASD